MKMQARLDVITAQAIAPALTWLPPHMHTGLAKLLMLAYGLQESQLLYRKQLGSGPARGLWQFELGQNRRGGGGVWGLWHHPASHKLLIDACAWRGVHAQPKDIWAALEHDDVLAAVLARLLMWTDAMPLPTTSAAAWTMYAKRTWCPGKPKPDAWPRNWSVALDYAVRHGWVRVNEAGALV